MFLFSRHTDKNAVAKAKNSSRGIKKDVLISDYLNKIEDNISYYQSLYLFTSKLKNYSSKSTLRQNLLETFDTVIKKFGGEIFGLPNDDIIIIYNKKAIEEIQACLIKIKYIFHDDPLIKDAYDLEQVNFIKYYELSGGALELKETVKAAMISAGNNKDRLDIPNSKSSSEGTLFSARKLRRELTPTMLGKVQKSLAMTDFSSLIRRQSVCAVIGKSSPQVLFDEVFVSIADLRDMLLPDVDLTANPWLFLHLAGTLDKRVLVHVSRHDDGALTSNFSLNLNVSTILSDDFLEFDENINASFRSTIVLELQLVDIFSDIKAYMLAKTFAQYRGYKICIDGITVDKLKYIRRAELGADLIKIIWHPSLMDVINEDKHFMDYVNRSERAKMILCRVDDPNAVDIGNSLGINLYQGRHIQRLLANQPKKTIFNLK